MQQLQGSPIRVGQSVGGATQDLAVIWAQLAQMSTCELVKVIAVNGDRLTVQPLLFKVDADNNSVKRGEIFNVPFIRLQGGSNAVIIDPVAGDIGMCCYASRDISLLKRIKDFVAPNSKRMYDVSDAIYIGGVLNGTPTQIVEFTNGGINITSPNQVTINATKLQVNCPIEATGDIKSGSISLQTHVHGGVQSGGSSTGVPQ